MLHLHKLRKADAQVPGAVEKVDDNRYATLACPPSTTIAQPAAQIGERGMHHLMRILEGKAPPAGAEYLPHQLVLRRSVA